ncbi:MAG: ribosome biogenesis GTP-binding protein YsxC [Parcubacteria group bacterium]|nr:ribosome biogenesis GTP-binding protein YsxC [Parcubacteria group bacterium]
MKITSAEFMKGVVGTDEIFEDGTPQIAFIGRSNVGKSSVINSLTKQKDLARTSSFPGRTQEINIFLINRSFYLVDLPGYGFAQGSHELRGRLLKLIDWYLLRSGYIQKKIVFIIDAYVGPTEIDLEVFQRLIGQGKNIIVVANKIDKLKQSEYKKQLKKIQDVFKDRKVIPYSSFKKIGIKELTNEILA